jgi:hypothetical protein
VDGPVVDSGVGVVEVVELVGVVLARSVIIEGKLGKGKGTYGHVVELVLVCTPYCICQIVLLSDYTYGFVSVVWEDALTVKYVTFKGVGAPVLDVYVFALGVVREHGFRDKDGLAVKVVTKWDAG